MKIAIIATLIAALLGAGYGVVRAVHQPAPAAGTVRVVVTPPTPRRETIVVGVDPISRKELTMIIEAPSDEAFQALLAEKRAECERFKKDGLVPWSTDGVTLSGWMSPEDAVRQAAVRGGFEMLNAQGKASQAAVNADLKAHGPHQIFDGPSVKAAPVVYDRTDYSHEGESSYPDKPVEKKPQGPLVWRTGTQPGDDEAKPEYHGPGKVLPNGDVLFERGSAKPAVHGTPVVPDPLGLGERLALMDVLVEHFHQDRPSLMGKDIDALTAVYWEMVARSGKPSPYPESK